MLKNTLAAGRPLFAALCAVILMLAAVTVGYTQSGPLEDLANFPRATLQILHGKSKKDPRTFTIWIADSPARQEQGLMFVRDLPASQGMLFPQAKPRPMSMWMKNTYIELDMLFIGTNGRVTKIIERAAPLSLATLSSGEPVAAVLELRGGAAAKLGLKVGDAVSWKKPTA